MNKAKLHVIIPIMVMLIIMFSTLALAACAQPAAGEVVISEKKRLTSPIVNETELSELVNGNNAFAFNMYRALKEGDSNFFYSPYSISQALAMTYVGARGETAQQMADTMHFTLSQDNLHPAFNSLDIELSERGEGAQGKDGDAFRLNIVNAIWGQKDYVFLPDFLDTLAENYGAGLRIVDFVQAPEESRVTINDWVSEQTEGRIEDLIPQGLIDAMTRLVLTNAIYFNAAWQHPFDENATHNTFFYLLDGNKVPVSMMNQTESFGYAEGEGYQAVELLYDGGEISMVVFLPEAGNFAAFEETFNAQRAAEIIAGIERRQVTLSMPEFEFESEFSLKKALTDMGMPVAFTADADFSGMTGNRELSIADVIHKSFVSVDEAGTEAAAATAVVMKLTAAPAAPVVVTIDRPFIFLIRDMETSTVLFVGCVVNPSA